MIKRRPFVRIQAAAYADRVWRAVRPGGHALSGGTSCQPFFIVGAGRSGTTLLRRILCAGEGIHIPPETGLLPVIELYLKHRTMSWGSLVGLIVAYFEYRRHFLYSMRPLAERLRALPQSERSLAAILDNLYRYDAEVNGVQCNRWGDKTPRNYECMDEILRVFPEARFVHLYRDGCDVAASLVRYGVEPDWASAAQAWVDSVETTKSFAADRPDRLFEVRYEELVSTPEPTTRALCGYLGMAFDEAMITASHEDMERYQIEMAEDLHQNLGKPISQENVGKGRAELTGRVRDEIAPIIDSALERMGYPRACEE